MGITSCSQYMWSLHCFLQAEAFLRVGEGEGVFLNEASSEIGPEFQKHLGIFSVTSYPTIADLGSAEWGGNEKEQQTKIKKESKINCQDLKKKETRHNIFKKWLCLELLVNLEFTDSPYS